KLALSLTAAALAMFFSMPLMESPGHGRDPFMLLLAPLSAVVLRVAPWVYQLTSGQLRYVLLGLTLPVVGWAGRHFYTRAWAAFRHHSADMNTLIAVGTGAAFLFSLATTFFAGWLSEHGIQPNVYYEAVLWIIAFILLGNLFEARAKGRTSSAIRRLIGLQPA